MPISPSGVETVPYLFNQQSVGSANFPAQLDADLNDLATAITQVNQGTAPGTNQRLRLTTATTYYIATNGNDANDGKTPATAWLTFAHAMAVLSGQVDFSSQTVTLQAVAGHASFTTGLTIPPLTGGGALIVDFGGGSIALTSGACITTASAAGVPDSTQITVQAGTLSSVNGDAIDAFHGGRLTIGTGITFGACGGSHINVVACIVSIPNNYSVSGGASRHWRTQNFGTISTGSFNPTIANTSGGNLAFGIFAFASNGSQMSLTAIFQAAQWSGTTGQRYLVQQSSAIGVFNAGPNYLPGNAAGFADAATFGSYS